MKKSPTSKKPAAKSTKTVAKAKVAKSTKRPAKESTKTVAKTATKTAAKTAANKTTAKKTAVAKSRKTTRKPAVGLDPRLIPCGCCPGMCGGDSAMMAVMPTGKRKGR
jgi:hypothetical protein